MNVFPDTTTGKKVERHPSARVLAAVCCGLVLVAAAVSLWPGDFSPGEEVISAGFNGDESMTIYIAKILLFFAPLKVFTEKFYSCSSSLI